MLFNPVCPLVPVRFCNTNINEGMVATATRTILENLGRLPNEDQRTKIAIIAYDTSVYFFSMSVSCLVSCAYQSRNGM
jgi:protein transport protein SEC24